MFSKVKLIASGAAVLTVVLVVYFGYRHYSNLIKDKSLVEQTNVTLRNALDIESATVRDLRNATGDWKDAQERLLQHVKEMQENSDDAELETKHLRQMFSEMDWDSTTVNSTTDRLWGLISATTERGSNRIGEADSTATAESETGRAD